MVLIGTSPPIAPLLIREVVLPRADCERIVDHRRDTTRDGHRIGGVQRVLADPEEQRVAELGSSGVCASVLHEAGAGIAAGVNVVVAVLVALPGDGEIAGGVHRDPRVLLVALRGLVHLEDVAGRAWTLALIAAGEDAVLAVDARPVAVAHAVLAVARPGDDEIAV